MFAWAPDIELVAKDVPQAAIGIVEAFLAVNLENVARPGHVDFDDVFDFSGTMGDDDHPIGKRNRFDQIVRDKDNRLALLFPDF
jgi:hypothetical protein